MMHTQISEVWNFWLWNMIQHKERMPHFQSEIFCVDKLEIYLQDQTLTPNEEGWETVITLENLLTEVLDAKTSDAKSIMCE